MPFAAIDPDKGGASRPGLDGPPPRPPRQGRSVMDMATDNAPADQINMSNPAVQVMSVMGDARNALLKLGTLLPALSQGLQQMVQGLEQVVPQQVADMVAGMAPGAGGSSMGTGMGAGPAAPQAASAPSAPPVQTGMP